MCESEVNGGLPKTSRVLTAAGLGVRNSWRRKKNDQPASFRGRIRGPLLAHRWPFSVCRDCRQPTGVTAPHPRTGGGLFSREPSSSRVSSTAEAQVVVPVGPVVNQFLLYGRHAVRRQKSVQVPSRFRAIADRNRKELQSHGAARLSLLGIFWWAQHFADAAEKSDTRLARGRDCARRVALSAAPRAT